jgi:hypothetical protein
VGFRVAEGDVKYDRGSTLAVAPGLHIFRYVSFQGSGVPAICRLIPPNPDVSVLDMPGRDKGVLQQPGDCLVVRAERASDVVVALRRGAADGSLDATFRLEPVVLVEGATSAPAPQQAAPSLSFLAHLANRGDTAFEQNVWAGGPESPAAVEGLQIVADGGGSVLEMQVLVGSRPPRWSEWVGAGQYAGTRGHSLPLLGFRLRVKPEAQNVEIASEALFLGALVAAQRGRQVEFVSGSGVDPLIGVKISIQTVQDAGVGRTVSGADAQAQDREPRVRVFRASTSR